MKAVLVIDMPNNCLECPLHDVEYNYCVANDDAHSNTYIYERESWCPLRLLPEKKGNPIYKVVGTYEDGFDACLKEITGETE